MEKKRCAAVRSGERFEYLLFRGHRPRADGEVDACCPSQWYSSTTTVDGVFYRTAEHFMMAEKARPFGDRGALSKVLEAATPNDAKKPGRKVTPFDQDRWNEHCFEIVVRGNEAELASNSRLRDFLLATGDEVLVEEDSPYRCAIGHRKREEENDEGAWRR